MRHIVWMVSLCSMLGVAYAADAPAFKERVRRAQAVEREAESRAYLEKHLVPALGAVEKQVQGCLHVPGSSKEDFTLVANLAKNGALADIDYQPRTNTAQCIAGVMGKVKVTTPPATQDAAGLPIYIHWNLSK